MLKKLLFIGGWLALSASLMAEQRVSTTQFSSGDSYLDSLIIQLNRIENRYAEQGIGKLRLEAIVQGSSTCTQNSWMSHIISDILPFDWKLRTYTFDALCQGSYQYPCDLQITPVSIFAKSRRSKKALREINQVILPFDGMKLMNDEGSNKTYISPFSNDGISQYYFYFNESIIPDDTTITIIHFAPKRKHHSLTEGDAWVDKNKNIVTKITFEGLIDFGQVNDTIYYREEGAPFIDRSTITINYNYGKTKGTNRFDCLYNITQFESLTQLKSQPRSFDLTDIYKEYTPQIMELPEAVYTTKESDTIATDSSRISQIDTTGTTANSTTSETRKAYREKFQEVSKRLVGRSYFDVFGSELRVNGPLNPSSIGYDKHNGLTLRQRLRYSKRWSDGRLLQISPEIGYSFGYHQLRYRLNFNWQAFPSKRANLEFSMKNKASGFSSKFKEIVDNAISEQQKLFEKDKKKPWRREMNFDDLELYFFHHHEVQGEFSYELTNGLMAYVGALYNYRTPERHGSRSISQEQFDLLVEDHYADLSPVVRLEYTPQQYYYYRNGYKEYLASAWPTFTFEAAQGIYGWFGSKSNYTRLEIDAHQNIKIGSNRSISYHTGAGMFFRQKGEYFINYHYFARSQYPSSWEEKIGGSFSLLNDYWYCSSPGYVQAHIMYESPFLLLNKIPAISKYVIKERIYLSNLFADGKNAYTEFGYGMGNNYFNIGAFGSMIGLKLWDFGVKFTIEIEQHL